MSLYIILFSFKKICEFPNFDKSKFQSDMIKNFKYFDQFSCILKLKEIFSF